MISKKSHRRARGICFVHLRSHQKKAKVKVLFSDHFPYIHPWNAGLKYLIQMAGNYEDKIKNFLRIFSLCFRGIFAKVNI